MPLREPGGFRIRSIAIATVLLVLPLAASALASDSSSFLAPRHEMATLMLASAQPPPQPNEAGLNDLNYHGGPVQHAPAVFLTFWCWQGVDPSNVAPYLTAFLSGIGGRGWANIQTQYNDGAGAITNPEAQLEGVWRDDSCLVPPNPDAGLAQEAVASEAHFGGFVPDAQYVIATPHLHSTAGFGSSFCAWHSYVGDGSGHQISFTNLPYMTDAGRNCGQNFIHAGSHGLLDGVSIVEGHEYAESVTDPQLNAWYDSTGRENGDKCAWIPVGTPGGMSDIALSTGLFGVQTLYSNAFSGCVLSYPMSGG